MRREHTTQTYNCTYSVESTVHVLCFMSYSKAIRQLFKCNVNMRSVQYRVRLSGE